MSRVVIVTGAAGGIGWATALRFFERKTRIMLVDHPSRMGKLSTLMASVERKAKRAGGVGVFGVDSTDRVFVEKCIQAIIAKHGRIDVLANIAGVVQKLEPFVHTDLDAVKRVMEVNFWGTLHFCKAVLPHMRERGFGRIMNISSISGLIADPGNLIYSASKSALNAFTKGLAREATFNKDGRPHNITVNAIAPGLIETDLIAAVSEKMKEHYRRTAAAGRMGKPEEIAEVIYWLATRAPQFLTGMVIPVDGGFLQ